MHQGTHKAAGKSNFVTVVTRCHTVLRLLILVMVVQCTSEHSDKVFNRQSAADRLRQPAKAALMLHLSSYDVCVMIYTSAMIQWHSP